jgi:hypothetical protein
MPADVAAACDIVQHDEGCCCRCCCCRLSALEAVVEDGQSLHDSSYVMSPELQSRLRLVYSQASTSLALMAAAAKGYGRHSSSKRKRKQLQQQQQGDEKDVEQGSGNGDAGAALGSFCGCVGAFGRSWAQAKEELAEFMLVSCLRCHLLPHCLHCIAGVACMPIGAGHTWDSLQMLKFRCIRQHRS